MQLMNDNATAMPPPIPMSMNVLSQRKGDNVDQGSEPRSLIWARLVCLASNFEP